MIRRNLIRLVVYSALAILLFVVYERTRPPKPVPETIAVRWLGYANDPAKGLVGQFEITNRFRNLLALWMEAESYVDRGALEYWEGDTNSATILRPLKKGETLLVTVVPPNRPNAWRLSVNSVMEMASWRGWFHRHFAMSFRLPAARQWKFVQWYWNYVGRDQMNRTQSAHSPPIEPYGNSSQSNKRNGEAHTVSEKPREPADNALR